MNRYVASTLIIVNVLLLLGLANGHDSNEPPHYKYSAKANLNPSSKFDDTSIKHIWVHTIGSVLLISVVPLICLLFVPDLNKHRNILQILLGFAAGSLLGDSFLHLIPHALLSTEDNHEEGHQSEKSTHHGHSHAHLSHETSVFLWVIGGIFAFLCIEKLLRFFKPTSNHDHLHNAPIPIVSNKSDPIHPEGKKNKKQNAGKHNDNPESKKSIGDTKQISNTGKSNKKKTKHNAGLQAAAYLNLAADFTHNFTDGIAIAGSFLISTNVGYITTFAVLVHELPHELGDYAILIQSGCGPYKAMFLQLTTALGAIFGASISLILSGVGVNVSAYGLNPSILSSSTISTRLMPLTAGGFIYIALVSVLPDLLSTKPCTTLGVKPSIFQRLTQSVLELSAFGGGVALMAAITLLE